MVSTLHVGTSPTRVNQVVIIVIVIVKFTLKFWGKEVHTIVIQGHLDLFCKNVISHGRIWLDLFTTFIYSFAYVGSFPLKKFTNFAK